MKATLCLLIGRTLYGVHPLESGAWRLTTKGGRQYDVRRWIGQIQCDCPDYLFRREAKGEVCKHITALVDVGLFREGER